MALQSQAPRSGTSRRYTSSNRRKKGLTPWLALLGIAVIVGGIIYIFNQGPSPAANANTPANNTPDGGGEDGAIAQAGNDRSTNLGSGQSDTPTRNPANPRQRDAGSDPANQERVDEYVQSVRQLRGETLDQYENGMQQLEAGNIVTGRALLSELLFRDGALPFNEAEAVRQRLQHVNSQTVFRAPDRSTERINADPVLSQHRVQSGEYLINIANTYRTPYQLIERINNTTANRLQLGQALQVINGPIHARIDKSEYRMDLFVYDTGGLRIYLTSFDVGLGEVDSTPVGMWRIRPGSKVGPDAANNTGPSWRNPRTGEFHASDDPDIPIGEYWMGLEGTDERTREHQSYGIHATNDPDSIGRQESMGCVRMRDADIDQVFYMLYEGVSTVEIVP